ncbi:MAG TPA: hypothetical protein VGK30_01915, partial [Candidatus Binatia bacterium]
MTLRVHRVTASCARRWLAPPRPARLEEFLAPSFAVTTARAGDVAVTLAADGDRHERLVRACDARGDDAFETLFRLDQGVVRLPVFHDDAQRPVAYDAKFACFYSLAAGIEVIGHPRLPTWRTGAMRVVREIATVRALAAGARLLHAGGLVIGGGALAIAGPKGAGKSTLLCHLAAAAGAALLANDRLLVSDGAPPEPPMIRGVPTAVGLRPDTLAMFPHVAADLPDRTRPIRLSPAQLARGLGVGRV